MDLSEFGNCLESCKNVPKKHRPFYMRWAEAFVRYSKNRSGPSESDRLIEPFLEVFRLIEKLGGVHALMAKVIYGSGLRRCFFKGGENATT